MEYSKGEWKYKKAGHLAQFDVFCGDWREPENILATGIDNEANAHLIASAPDLYEACKALIDFTSSLPLDGSWQAKRLEVTRLYLKAIAKAEGK